jgi:hypothetical protein
MTSKPAMKTKTSKTSTPTRDKPTPAQKRLIDAARDVATSPLSEDALRRMLGHVVDLQQQTIKARMQSRMVLDALEGLPPVHDHDRVPPMAL